MICNGLKWTIFTTGGLELLLMVLELGTERCAREDAGSRKGWMMRPHIGWREE